jgi:glucosyl-3-phosphoglycerate synthase
VDIGLLIDAHRAGARLAEVDIGSLEHDSQPLLDLTAMANEVSRVIYTRARAAGRLHMEQIAAMYETQRQATATLDYILTRRRGRTRLILLDMDGTITPERYVVELARATGHEAALARLLDEATDDACRDPQRAHRGAVQVRAPAAVRARRACACPSGRGHRLRQPAAACRLHGGGGQ